MTYGQKYGCSRTEGKTSAGIGEPAAAASPRDGGEETRALRAARDMDYLFGSFGQFWERRGEIICTPEIYGIYPLFSGLSLAYVGGGPLSLGMLFYLWRTGQWLAECPECGSTALIYFAGGSPLSGMNRWVARCIFCGANVAGRAEKFHELWRPAKALIDEAESEKRRLAEQSAPPEENPREDFRAISRRWRRDYDEKSEAELEQAARERGERREAERLRALENERKSCEALGLTPGALPTETAEAMLKKLETHKEKTT